MSKNICFSPETLLVYGYVDGNEAPSLSKEEIIINQWLDEQGVHMADPLDLVHGYFEEKKKSLIKEKSDKIKKPSNLWSRRKEMVKPVIGIHELNKSLRSSEDEISSFFE